MSIVQNRKAFHDYFIEEKYEAGMALSGWEAKAIRAGRAQIAEAYVVMKDGGLYLIGAHITASCHGVHACPTRSDPHAQAAAARQRTRALDRQSRARRVHPRTARSAFKNGWIKLEIGLAKGKKQHDKREAEKERDWQREKQRLIRSKS